MTTRNLSILLTFLMMAAICHGFEAQILAEHNIRIVGDTWNDIAIVSQIARMAAVAVDAWLGFVNDRQQLVQPPKEELIFSIDSQLDAFVGDDVLEISSQENFHITVFKMVRMIVLRRARDMTGERSHRILPCSNWIAAALAERIIYGTRTGSRPMQSNAYQLRSLYENGRFPVVRQLLLMTPPENDVLLRLYFLQCDAFAACFEDAALSRENLKSFFTMEFYGRDAVESVTFMLQPLFQPREDLQYWFQRTVLPKCVRNKSDRFSETIRERLYQLLMIPVTDTDGLKMVSLITLVSKYQDYKIDREALRILQSNLERLGLEAPVLLNESIREFIKAIDLLKENKTKQFQKAYLAADDNFLAAFSRQVLIEQGFDSLEEIREGLSANLYQALQIHDSCQKLLFPLDTKQNAE